MRLENSSIFFYPSLGDLWSALEPWLTSKKHLWVIDRGFSNTSIAGESFKQVLQAQAVWLDGGESVKSWQTLEAIFDRLHEIDPGVEGIVALGGGATLDVAALAAHLYRRGIELIDVPTTLLAMVDASIGGKCAINWHLMKNRIGAYHLPKAIFSSIQLLGDHPTDPVVMEGLSELYKHALLASAPLREKYLEFLKTKDLDLLATLLPLAASIKQKAVELEKTKDHRDIRHLLNLGHTVAHALEAAFAESRQILNHGKAVAVGLLVESYVLKQHWETPFFSHHDLRRDLLELTTPWPAMTLSQWERFFQAMKLDKKGGGEDIALSKFGKIFQMMEPQSSYLAYCKPQEIVDAWRACEYAVATDLRDK